VQRTRLLTCRRQLSIFVRSLNRPHSRSRSLRQNPFESAQRSRKNTGKSVALKRCGTALSNVRFSGRSRSFQTDTARKPKRTRSFSSAVCARVCDWNVPARSVFFLHLFCVHGGAGNVSEGTIRVRGRSNIRRRVYEMKKKKKDNLITSAHDLRLRVVPHRGRFAKRCGLSVKTHPAYYVYNVRTGVFNAAAARLEPQHAAVEPLGRGARFPHRCHKQNSECDLMIYQFGFVTKLIY